MKVLIIRFSSIGDIVLTTPLIRCLKKQKQVEIHYLTKQAFKEILQENPYIDKIFAIKENIYEVLSDLKSENYDLIIDLHHNLRSQLVKKNLKKKSFAFRKLNVKKWLYTKFKINILPAIHIVDRYMETVKQLGVQMDDGGLDYFIPAADEVKLPPPFNENYIAFVIGAKHQTKQLPLKKIEEVIQLSDKKVVLLGGKDELKKADEIMNLVGDKAFNACGKYNLNQSASIIKQADKVITHDTGLMHIAAAFKKDIISVWGNTVPEFGMYPYRPGKNSKIVEVKNLSCRPCTKLGYHACPKKHFNCMEQIPVTEIFT